MALGGDQSGELMMVEKLLAAVEMMSPMAVVLGLTDSGSVLIHIQ